MIKQSAVTQKKLLLLKHSFRCFFSSSAPLSVSSNPLSSLHGICPLLFSLSAENVTWHAGRNVSSVLWIYFTYPSKENPIEGVCKGEVWKKRKKTWKVIGWTLCMNQRTNQICTCQLSKAATPRCFLLVRGATPELEQHCAISQTHFHLRQNAFYSPCNYSRPPRPQPLLTDANILALSMVHGAEGANLSSACNTHLQIQRYQTIFSPLLVISQRQW